MTIPQTDAAGVDAAPAVLPPLEAAWPALFAAALDEIEHGLLLLDLSGRILHANHPARRELASQRVLREGQGGALCASNGTAHARIRLAMHDAERDCRRHSSSETSSERSTLVSPNRKFSMMKARMVS